MYFIKILNTETNRRWEEVYQSYYDFRKRVIKLNHSKILLITSRSDFED